MGLGLVSTVTIVLWVALMMMGGAPAEETIQAQLASLSRNMTLYKLGFASAFMTGLGQAGILLLLAWSVVGSRLRGVADLLGAGLALPYLVLVSIAYSSQFALLPSLLREFGPADPLTRSLYFNAGTLSFSLAVLGYAFWGISAILIATKFVSRTGLYRAVGWTMALAGLANITGFLGHATGSGIAPPGVILGSVFTLVWLVLVVFLGRVTR